ncbi:MAG: hypothetical protein ACRD2D_01235 [Terriglobales bacterium]
MERDCCRPFAKTPVEALKAAFDWRDIPGYIAGMASEGTGTAQARAVRAYRQRLRKQGLARFEVLGRARDRELIRRVAQRLAAGGTEACALRDELTRELGAHATGLSIVDAFLHSPWAGADLKLERYRGSGRKLSL